MNDRSFECKSQSVEPTGHFPEKLRSTNGLTSAPENLALRSRLNCQFLLRATIGNPSAFGVPHSDPSLDRVMSQCEDTMRKTLSYKRLVRVHRRFLIRASRLVGSKARLI